MMMTVKRSFVVLLFASSLVTIPVLVMHTFRFTQRTTSVSSYQTNSKSADSIAAEKVQLKLRELESFPADVNATGDKDVRPFTSAPKGYQSLEKKSQAKIENTKTLGSSSNGKTATQEQKPKHQSLAQLLFEKMHLRRSDNLPFKVMTTQAKYMSRIPKKYKMLSDTNPFENLTRFLNPDEKFCGTNDTKIIATVISAAPNFEQRSLIRSTWANEDYWPETKMQAVFILGAVTNGSLQDLILKEARLHGDIIQTNYLDNYRSLTYKTMAALMWVSETCGDAPWVMKIDDDVLLNPFSLVSLLNKDVASAALPSVILGRYRGNSSPFRNGKWALTKEEYSGIYYPPFILGSAYIIGRKSIGGLVYHARQTTFLFLEDVFFTGIVAGKAQIPLASIEGRFCSSATKPSKYRRSFVFYLGATSEPPNVWQSIWELINNR